MKKLKVLQIGMGPLGVKIASYINQRKGIETISAVDTNPNLIGNSLSDFEDALNPNVKVVSSVSDAIALDRPDVAILTTVSDMERITPQIEEIVALGIPVVSTCEELSYPWENDSVLAARINEAAELNNVAVVGTGVNPGFLMDALPSFLTSVCQDVEKVEVLRFQDATYRRIPFQKKIGAGLNLNEFEERKTNGTLRHVGLAQSIQYIAHKIGWNLDEISDDIYPVVATKDIGNNGTTIKKGDALGVLQIGTGKENGVERVKLEFKAALHEPETFDQINIIGNPNLSSRIEGGVNGDIATCAITINAVASIIKAKSGLRTMADIPATSFFTNIK